MAGVVTALCALTNITTAPPGITFQSLYFSLYSVDRNLCPPINPDTEVHFYLYTRNNKKHPDLLKTNNDSLLENSRMNFDKPTYIFFHGFLESYEAKVSQGLKDAHLKKEDCNVILVDMKVLLAGLHYITAANNVQAIGEFAALFVDYLVSKGLDLEIFEVTGMSLGGQISGIVGANVKSGRISKITAYDPAGPLFNFYPENKRLNPNCAKQVIVIHSNPTLNGFYKSCGTVDFWVNGTPLLQPGCDIVQTSLRSLGNIGEIVFCSHYLSYRLAIYAINNPQQFPARKCNNYISYLAGKCNNNDLQYLGAPVDASASGDYMLTVGSEVYTTLGLGLL